MPSWHQAQYEHNHHFAEDVDEAEYPDWKITGLFYSALHLVQEVLLEEFGVIPRGHEVRNKYVYRCAATLPIARQYAKLRDLSQEARYMKPHHDLGEHHLDRALSLFCEIRDHLAPE
ncbi:MAG: hypothetical protein ACOC7J_04200 [Armatimonadota bacterium]